jgi:hypothetical protein
MPIKGVTDGQRFMPRLGKIHLGIRKFRNKDDKKGYPQATNYFVVPDEVKAVYGEQPTELDVMFLSSDLSVIMPHWFKVYGASTVAPICRGDGCKAQRLDLKTGSRIEVECLSPKLCKFNQYIDGNGEVKAKGCAPTLNLMVNLPGIPGLGTYQIDSKSWNGLRELLNDIGIVKAALNGRIAFVPLKLRLMEREVDRQDPVKGQTKKRIRYMHLSYEGTIGDLAKLPASLVPALKPGDDSGTVAVPEPDESKPDDIEDVVDGTLEPETTPQETPRTLTMPAKRDQLAAIEGLAVDKTAEDLAILSIQSINVRAEPPTVTVGGQVITIDAAYAALLICQLQDGYAPEDPVMFAKRFE